MLQPRQEVYADIFSYFGVPGAVRRSMDQRSGAAPIFVRSVGKENLRYSMGLCRCVEQPRRGSRLRISFRQIGKRKQVRRIEDAGHRLGIARRLGKAVVKAAAAPAGDMRDDAAHHRSSLFVGIEVLVKKMAQEAPTLRDA